MFQTVALRCTHNFLTSQVHIDVLSIMGCSHTKSAEKPEVVSAESPTLLGSEEATVTPLPADNEKLGSWIQSLQTSSSADVAAALQGVPASERAKLISALSAAAPVPPVQESGKAELAEGEEQTNAAATPAPEVEVQDKANAAEAAAPEVEVQEQTETASRMCSC